MEEMCFGEGLGFCEQGSEELKGRRERKRNKKKKKNRNKKKIELKKKGENDFIFSYSNEVYWSGLSRKIVI